jgi:hypothetical protein
MFFVKTAAINARTAKNAIEKTRIPAEAEKNLFK